MSRNFQCSINLWMRYSALSCSLKVSNSVHYLQIRHYIKTVNKAVVLHGKNDLRLEEIPIPGTPAANGHEGAGTVVEVGKDVKHLKPGDRVALEPGCPCRRCELCKTGKYNICKDMFFCGTPQSDHGFLVNYCHHEADFCFKLPDNVNYNEGAMVEMLSVGVHACRRGNVQLGTVAVIFGAGSIGLSTLMAAQAFGASQTLIVDTNKFRLDMAKSIGANHIYHIKGTESVKEMKQGILSILKTEPDVSFDASSVENSIRATIELTKPGGKALLLGFGTTDMNISLKPIIFREIDVLGAFRYVNTWPTAIEMITTGRVNLKPLITHTYSMEDTRKAIEKAEKEFHDAVKIQINVNPQTK